MFIQILKAAGVKCSATSYIGAVPFSKHFQIKFLLLILYRITKVQSQK
jgi:hypothetical protein